MIEIRDLTVRFDQKVVLDGFSADVPLSGTTAVEGPSGAGKTTLLRVLCGLTKPDGGRVSGLSGLRVGMLFQEDRLLPWRTALENVCEVTDAAQAAVLLTDLGLGDAMHLRPAALSGGMQRRTAIARLLALPSDILLLDEPFTGLDEAAKRVAAAAILRQNAPVLVVTHDESEAALLQTARRIRIAR